MTTAKHILVLRFSALGDVAITVPVIKAVLAQDPHLSISFASRPVMAGLFEGIERLTFIPVDLDNEFKGPAGIIRLFRYLKSLGPYDALADLHDILRSKMLRVLFRLSGLPYRFIDKGREGKRLLTRFPHKVRVQQQLTTERYADVFRKLGCPVSLDHKQIRPTVVAAEDVTALAGSKVRPWVGIAPFAQHKGKIYPLERMEQVVAALSKQDVQLFLFGGTVEEAAICADWQQRYPNVLSVIRRLPIARQQLLIRQLDVMVSMDSAAMHLASNEGVPVVSIWGATHPYLGFVGYGQSDEGLIYTNIECQPCSTYGQKPCFRGDYACLHGVEPAAVVLRVNSFLSAKG